MLRDVTFLHDPNWDALLVDEKIPHDDREVMREMMKPPPRLATGVYQINLNIVHEVPEFAPLPDWEETRRAIIDGRGDEARYAGPFYGVCDHYKQAVAFHRLDSRPEPFALFVTEIRKNHEPPQGGWRWHKWGDYIGDQTPTAEHLYDEPVVEVVFVYEAKLLR